MADPIGPCSPRLVANQLQGDLAMPWVYLVIAGLFEVGFASVLKLTEGFTKLWPSLIFAVCIVLSMYSSGNNRLHNLRSALSFARPFGP